MPTPVRLPRSLIYPVEITQVFAGEGAPLKRHQPLLQYKYWNEAEDGVRDDGEAEMVTKEFYAHFESPLAGTLGKMHVQVGDRINDSTTNIANITEDCDHSVQYGGLCALCGRSLDDQDYLGYSDADRAPIAMSHDTNGLTVSRNEAERIEKVANDRLVAEKRLILVVDLDQTIIHAAMDPAIGQWMADPNSPNHNAVRDVRKFCLKEQRRDKIVDCWYYVKLRPGLSEFLKQMAQIFEMHIYTMATKAYAREVAKLIDPTGEYFGDRILSREESGNLLQKSLARLFPVRTQLVMVIDDRGDVWQWSKHLVRVFPYNFFQGTGDINSQFLPKRSGLVTPENSTDGSEETNEPEPLADNDTELASLGKHLSMVHSQFYSRYGADAKKIPDVATLLPAIKTKVFDGCVFLFSGIFPVGTALDSADIVQWVRSFGAVVVAEFIPAVTHVIAHAGGTVKARQAAGAGVPVINTSWLFACLRSWEREPLAGHLIDVKDPIKPSDAVDDAVDAAADGAEPQSDIAEGFVRSLSRGDMDWDAVNKELQEFMGSDDSDVFTDDEDEPLPEHDDTSAPGKRKREDDEKEPPSKKAEVEAAGDGGDGDEAGDDSDEFGDFGDDFAAELERGFQ